MAWPRSTGLRGERRWGREALRDRRTLGVVSVQGTAQEALGTRAPEGRPAVPERERREETPRGGSWMPRRPTAGVRYKRVRSPSASQETLASIIPVLKRALLCPWPLTKRNVLLGWASGGQSGPRETCRCRHSFLSLPTTLYILAEADREVTVKWIQR